VRSTSVDTLIGEIEHDLRDIHAELHHSPYADMCRLSRTIKNGWYPWIRGYIKVFGISVRDLEAIADEVRDVRFELKRIQRERRLLLAYELNRVRETAARLADIVGSYHHTYRTSDLRDVICYFSEIRRILAAV
jgi:hypothetical protein